MRLITLTLLGLSHTAYSAVQSETIVFLQADGERYLLQRSIHSDSPTHRFHLPKSVALEDIRHISPARFEWDEQSSEQVNSISFEDGGFTLIYPAQFSDKELQREADGSRHYRSWDGNRDAAGRYGYWYSPGQFDQYSYSWILPDNIELLRYRSNRQGKWTRRGNAISFYAEQVNNLTFEISYRVKPTQAMPAVATAADCPPPQPAPAASSCPQPAASFTPVRMSARPDDDSDADGIPDASDLCASSPAGARVDQAGCALDSDRDGVADGIDQCIATEEDTQVDAQGCARN